MFFYVAIFSQKKFLIQTTLNLLLVWKVAPIFKKKNRLKKIKYQSHITCHLLPTLTATATEPPPDTSLVYLYLLSIKNKYS